MNSRLLSRLVRGIGGWSLCLLACLVALWIWLRMDSSRQESDGPLSSSRVIPDGHPALEPPGESTLPPNAAMQTTGDPTPQTLTGQAATDALQKSGQYDSLGAAFHAARHAMQKIDPHGPHSRGAEYFAANPRQQLRAWFTREGVELASGLVPADPLAAPWSLVMRLTSAGRADALDPVAATAVAPEGNSLAMTGAAGVAQWFVNDGPGLEQGFTIAERPRGAAAEIAVVLSVASGLRAEMRAPEAAGGLIAFVDAAGAEVLHYRDLTAWDAAGTVLPARMELRGAEIALLVADAGAQYPVTIDPLFANPEKRFTELSVAQNHFGTAVALNGDTAVIGADSEDAPDGADVGAAYVFVRQQAVWRQQARLTAIDGRDFGRLGTSVALDGDTALVGAPFASRASGTNIGYAYVFTRTGSQWSQQVRLPLADNAAATFFGGAVALSGQTALIGASYDSAGTAYVYVRSGGTWSQQGPPLSVTTSGVPENLGSALALRGNTALLGAPGNDTRGANAGAVFVFQRTGAVWSQQGPALFGTDTAAGDGFGRVVALDGDTALIGAERADGAGVLDAGSAYFFVRSGTAWTQQGSPLVTTGALPGNRFGYAVALSGDTALIGADLEDATLIQRDGGSVRVLVRVGAVWSEQEIFRLQRVQGSENFGAALALAGDTALVGIFYDRTTAGPLAGSAQVHVRTEGVWTRQAVLTAGDGPNYDRFGVSVASDGDLVVVGAEFDDTPAGENAGSAFIFTRQQTRWHQEARLTASDAATSAEFGGSVAISGSTVLIGANFASTPAGASAGAAYVFERRAPAWDEVKILVDPEGQPFDNFGCAVALSGDTALVGAKGGATNAGSRAGIIRFFSRASNGVWNANSVKREGAGGSGSALFGSAVALRGDTAIVGAPDDETRPGAAYAFARTGGVWSTAIPLVAPDARNGNLYGTAVALHGDTAIVGAPGDVLGGAVKAGSAHIFVRSGGTWRFQAPLRPVLGGNAGQFGASVGVSGDLAIVGAPFADTEAGNDAGNASLFFRRGQQWTLGDILTAGVDASPEDEFGWSAALNGDKAVVGARREGTPATESGAAYFFTIGELPEIFVQPLPSTILLGERATFTVVATGLKPSLNPRVQWRKDGVDIPGATNLSYTIPSTNDADEGSYDVVIKNVGGIVISAAARLSFNGLPQFTQTFPGAPPTAQGFLTVNLSPAGIGAAWRFLGEQEWRPSGVPVGGLVAADRRVECRPVAEYLQPVLQVVTTPGTGATVLDLEYYRAGLGTRTGSVRVTLKPAALTAGTVPLASRAQWRFLGEGTPTEAAWRDSGTIATGKLPGVYLIECKPVAGRSTPPPLSVTIVAATQDGAPEPPPVQVAATYYLAEAPIGQPPQVLPFQTVSTDASLPYAFVGQIRSPVGAGSGFVLKVETGASGGARVVGTAAHVVFDDATLTAVVGLQWLLQRDRGSYEPRPVEPRGFYGFTGYAAQRAAEATPGESRPESQNLDVAALYFNQDIGRGGFSGYLASNAAANEWLFSPALKTLVGYPLNGIPPTERGRMHATTPANLTFTAAFGKTFTTDQITSAGGASGGPLCVQYDHGTGPKFYPAAIYLGGAGQTVVRAIDGEVVEMFRRAELSANGGPNNGDGGISQTNSGALAQGLAPASVQVTLTPAAAANVARWKLGANAREYRSGFILDVLSEGRIEVTFTPVPGFDTPAPQIATLRAGRIDPIEGTYVRNTTFPSITNTTQQIRAIRGVPLTPYLVQTTPAASSLSAPLLAELGLALVDGAITGTPTRDGSHDVFIVASNQFGSSAPFRLTIVVARSGELLLESNSSRGTVTLSPRRLGNLYAAGVDRVTLEAKPFTPGFLFSHWDFAGRADGITRVAAPKTSFVMAETVEARANFVPNPFLTRFGTYHGLVTDAAENPRGSITATVTNLGILSFRMQLEGETYVGKGALAADGHFTASPKGSGKTAVLLSLDLAVTESEPSLDGSVVRGTETFTISTGRASFSKKAPTPVAGQHTLALPRPGNFGNNSNQPFGHGYALVTVRPEGKVTAVGQLGDGTALSAGGMLRADHRWALFTRPYEGKGLLAGLVLFTPRAAPGFDELAGTLRLEPADGQAALTGEITAIGSRWVPPARGQSVFDSPYSATLRLANGGLDNASLGTATLQAKNQFAVTSPTPPAPTLILNADNGFLSGSLSLTGVKKPVPYKGVLLQGPQLGRGLFLPFKTGVKTGAVELEPNR